MWKVVIYYWRYPILHWLLTTVLGPLLLALWAVLRNDLGSPMGMREAYWLLVVFLFGFVLSMPAAIAYLLFFSLMMKAGRANAQVLIAGNVLVLAMMGLTTWIIGGYAMPTFFFAYSCALLIGNIFLRSQMPTRGRIGDQR